MNVADLTDLEFGDLLRQCTTRLERESKTCVRVEDVFESWFLIQMDNDDMDEAQEGVVRHQAIKQGEWIHFNAHQEYLDANYRP